MGLLATVLAQDLAAADNLKRAVAAGLAGIPDDEVLEHVWDLVLGRISQADDHRHLGDEEEEELADSGRHLLKDRRW